MNSNKNLVLIGMMGSGKSIVFRKKTRPRITTNPRIDLITNPITLVLPELVFLLNSI